MCFGVKDALSTARAVTDPRKVTIHGQLVHNPAVLRGLEARGFRFTPEGDRTQLPSTPSVMVTAHGISDRERKRLTAAGGTLIDTTCPLVVRIHEAAQRLAREGRLVLVVGRRGHVEIRGVVEDLERCEVVEGPEEVRDYGCDRLGLVCQTTATVELVERVHRAVLAANAGADVCLVDTVCGPTRDRQAALDALLEKVNAIVVVGGRNSNNTLRLVERCGKRGVPVAHVTGPGELCQRWCGRFQVVGLTAGTSTPDEVIDAVHAGLERMS